VTWFLASALVLLAALLFSSLIGRALASFGGRRRATIAFFYAPILGLAFWVHAAALSGWLIGFPRVPVLALTLTLAAAAAWRERRRLKGWLFSMPAMAVVAACSGWSLFAALIRYGAFNPFNDTFTYITQSQWLQLHPFRAQVTDLASHPALTQITHYQEAHLRMGAQFVLAWMQSAIGASWAHQVFPAAIVLPAACGCLALAGFIRAVTRAGRGISLALGLLPGMTLSGLTLGLNFGFLPQGFGLLFAFGAVALCAFRGASPWLAALCLSAQVYCYPEMLPFTLAGLAAAAVWGRNTHAMLKAAGLALLLAAPELPRVGMSMIYQVQSVVGVNLPLTPREALEHASGFHSGPLDDRLYLLGFPAATLAACATILLLAGVGLRRCKRWRMLSGCIAVVAVLAAAWAWFHFVERNPWDQTVGNPWRQERAAAYAAYFVLALVGCGLAALWRMDRRLRPALALLLAGWLGASALQSFSLARVRMAGMQREMQCARNCFEDYGRLREAVAAIPPDEPIRLAGFSPAHVKQRQMVAYSLIDRHLIGDWRDDDYIGPFLPIAPPVAPPEWAVTVDSPSAGRTGNLTLRPLRQVALVRSVKGGYPEEADLGGVWRWTPDSLEYEIELPAAQLGDLLRVHFTVSSLSARTITVTADGHEVERFNLPAGTVSERFTLPAAGRTVLLTIATPDPPGPPVPGDARRLSFMVRNLGASVVPVSPFAPK
jgi:hypothetical protein